MPRDGAARRPSAQRTIAASLAAFVATLALAALALVVPAAPASSQAKKKTQQEVEAGIAAHKGDFDYLLGDWAYTAVRKTPQGEQKFRGFWSALRLDEGQILDEYRVVSDEGDETWYVTTTLRNYNAFLDRWELVGADAGTGLMDMGTARKEGADMLIEQSFGVASGDTSTWRIRYYDIQKDRFSWEADRSTDGGKTWVKRHQTIEARRIGPPRSLPALAPPRP
jgi:hypothetical protein